MVIYVHPDCSKCKEALGLLQAEKCDYTIRNYLAEAPTIFELKDLLKQLGCKAEELIRKNEPLFLDKYANKNYSEDEWLQILSENPVLLQRPIVIDGNRAVIGRPPILILDLVKHKG